MIRIPVLLFLFLAAAGCRSKEKTYDYAAHRFDPQVIERLPLYDSLSRLLIQNFPSLQPDIKEKNSILYERSKGPSFRSVTLPPETVAKINGYLQQLGENFITGFSVYKDSSIKYFVRDTYLEPYYLTVRDRLSYFPNGRIMKHREPPLIKTRP